MQKYTAIILSSREVNEYDRIYMLYTLEKGLVRTIARGVRKPAARLAGHLEPGTLSEIYIARSRGMGQITGAIAVASFPKLRSDFEKLAEILKIFRFFTKNFSEEEQDKNIFALLRNFLEIADNSQSLALGVVIEAFWWKLFDFLGQKPEIGRCVACEKTLSAQTEKSFCIEKGGIFCANCKTREKEIFSVSDNQIKFLRIIFSNPLRAMLKIKLEKRENEGLKRIRTAYGKYHFG